MSGYKVAFFLIFLLWSVRSLVVKEDLEETKLYIPVFCSMYADPRIKINDVE